MGSIHRYSTGLVTLTEAVCMQARSLSHVQLVCDPVDCSPPGSSVHGISQARILERTAISSSRGSSQPRGPKPRLLRLLHWQVDSSLLSYQITHRTKPRFSPPNAPLSNLGKGMCGGTSLAIQWLRLCLPMQGFKFDLRSGYKDPTCLLAKKKRM